MNLLLVQPRVRHRNGGGGGGGAAAAVAAHIRHSRIAAAMASTRFLRGRMVNVPKPSTLKP